MDLFISDLHLDTPAGVRMLADWLASREGLPRRLFILGDLFEAWIGDDDDSALAADVAGLLAEQQRRGVAVAFLAGNRDFLVGQDYLDRCGATLLQEPAVIDSHGHSLLLVHGDRECTADSAYQRFRQQVRSAQWREAFLTQSLEQRREFAARARAQSRQHNADAAGYLLDADAGAMQQLLEQGGHRLLVHGHTHRPAMHLLQAAHGSCLRVVLGAWHQQPSWLCADSNGLSLHAEGMTLRARWPD